MPIRFCIEHYESARPAKEDWTLLEWVPGRWLRSGYWKHIGVYDSELRAKCGMRVASAPRVTTKYYNEYGEEDVDVGW